MNPLERTYRLGRPRGASLGDGALGLVKPHPDPVPLMGEYGRRRAMGVSDLGEHFHRTWWRRREPVHSCGLHHPMEEASSRSVTITAFLSGSMAFT